MADSFKQRQVSGKLEELPGGLSKLKLGAAYLRFSHDNSNPRSLDDQLVQVLKRARADGEFIPWTLVFADAGVSGRTANRGSYTALKRVIASQERSVSTVYIDDFSRGGRDVLEWLQLAAMVQRCGNCRIVGVSDGFDTSEKFSELKLAMFGMFSRYFVEQLREKVHRGMMGAARRGTTLGKLPLGYVTTPVLDSSGQPIIGADERVVTRPRIDEAGAVQVRRAFDLYQNGASSTVLARMFNQEAIDGSRGWSANRVLNMLRNPIYIGLQVFNRSRYELNPATGSNKKLPNSRSNWVRVTSPDLRIISTKQYLEVRRKIRKQAALHPSLGRKGIRNALYPTTLFSGTLFCGYCKKELLLVRSTEKYKQFSCLSGKVHAGECLLASSKSVRMVEQTLLHYVKDRFLSGITAEAVAKEAMRILEQERTKPRADVVALSATRDDIARRISNLLKLAESSSDVADAGVGGAGEVAELGARLGQLRRERSDVDTALRESAAAVSLATAQVTTEQVSGMLENLRALMNQDIQLAAPVLRRVLGDIEVTQGVKEEGCKGTPWTLRFKPKLAETLMELAVDSSYPDRSALEFLSNAIWTIAPEVELVIENKVPKYEQYRQDMVKRLEAGESQVQVARDHGVSPGVVSDAWRSHHSGGDPDGEAPPLPERPTLPEHYAERVAAIYHSTGRRFEDIGRELGITRYSAERAHQHWHELHPDQPGDIPHEATCSRCANLSPEMRKKVLSRLQEDRTRAEVAGELGVSEKDVRWVQMDWARYNRKKGTPLKHRGCRRWRGKGKGG